MRACQRVDPWNSLATEAERIQARAEAEARKVAQAEAERAKKEADTIAYKQAQKAKKK